MKPIIAAIFMLNLTVVARAEDKPIDSAPSETVPAMQKPEPVSPPSPMEKPLTTSDAPAVVSDKEQAKPEDTPVATVVQTPQSPVVAVPVAAEAAKVADVKPAEPVAVKPAGYVAHLQDLVTFHEKQITSVKQMIDRWNAKVGPTFKRRQDLQQDAKAKLQKVDELQKQNTKASKKEADGLKKNIAQINKDIQAVDRELKDQNRALTAELRDVSRNSQQALRDSYQQVISDIQKPEN